MGYKRMSTDAYHHERTNDEVEWLARKLGGTVLGDEAGDERHDEDGLPFLKLQLGEFIFSLDWSNHDDTRNEFYWLEVRHGSTYLGSPPAYENREALREGVAAQSAMTVEEVKAALASKPARR